ncbi:hypothetical protein [Pseudomonas sp. FP1740]|uniref:hypothetical protein n=1 Tax=Pseudomonas sp. FP1740 TaxID=2954078 RepID=UPI0027362825|nr:hypothetical protein [Pseudomonas sp. FP1740]WLG46422.1 hypothetical protein PSH69_07345 [Pseudomonas sp. FP1740]
MHFDLWKYDSANFLHCLMSASKFTTLETIQGKRHRNYLEQYFEEINAQTIVVEHAYVDRDYLQDYAAYYDRCFSDYSRRTKRLHFFNKKFGRKDLQKLIVNNPGNLLEADLKTAYLGFIVVRPLPMTIIGRTCLATYGADGGRRVFPSLRAYPVNLFGIELEVMSLAYQEQDTVVAACATSALWTCFHGTGKLFQHSIPAPVEITDWANEVMPENLLSTGARAFPNSGLSAKQMAHAIKQVDLDPFAVRAGSSYSLNSVVYAYLRGKIPLLLACHITSYDSGQEKYIGAHAVAITGFSLRDEESVVAANTILGGEDGLLEEDAQAGNGFRLRAAKIDKLYVHDDQIGPFARMEWSRMPTPYQMQLEQTSIGLKTSWSPLTFAVPDFVLLPLYHKIRIPFALIHNAMKALDFALETIRSRSELANLLDRAEWDIFLTSVNDYKTSVRNEYVIIGMDPQKSLYADLPRFMWRVILRSAGEVHAELLYDATGIAQQNLLVHSCSTGREYAQLLSLIGRHAGTVECLPLQARAAVEAFNA